MKLHVLSIAALSLAVAVAGPAAAQAAARAAVPPRLPALEGRLRTAVDALKADNAWTLDTQVSICEIPAPPFRETARGLEYRRRLEQLGLGDVRIDTAGNVIARRPGTGAGPTVVVAGHLDTVFPEGTDVTVKRAGSRLTSPGIGDDCRGLAVILAVARAFQQANVQTTGTVYFVGSVGEEGAGNLRGVRNLFMHELKGRVDYFISVDGPGFDVTSQGVGSNRYRVSYKGPGGHSYGSFGVVNPIHALGRAMARIADIRVPTFPKTTFNVGVIRGGTSVNSIPFEASMDIDMRSVSAPALAALDRQVRAILAQALAAENARWRAGTGGRPSLTMQLDTIGIRPGNGSQTDRSPIVASAIAAGKALGFAVPTGASSTDANFPMSLGIPAITMGGGGNGGGSHSLSEWYEETPTAYLGPQWVALLVAALAGVPSASAP